MKKVLLATLLGGLAMFIYTSLHHTVLPFASMGWESMPNEEAVLSSLEENLPEEGLFFFPGMDMSREHSEAEQEAWEEKHRNGPAGLLLYRPRGGEPMPASMLVIEFVSTVFAAFILALLAASLHGSYLKRAILLSVVGLFGWLAISISDWNWFGFPFAGILSEGIDIYLGALFAGLVIARIVPAPESGNTPAA